MMHDGMMQALQASAHLAFMLLTDREIGGAAILNRQATCAVG